MQTLFKLQLNYGAKLPEPQCSSPSTQFFVALLEFSPDNPERKRRYEVTD